MGHLLYWTLLLGVVAAACGFRVSDRDNEISLTAGDESSFEESIHEHSWHDEIATSEEQDVRTSFVCPDDGLYPNPRNCSTFIQCSNGYAHVMPCPKGLHYSVKTQRCEGPCVAHCNQTLSCACKWPSCNAPKECLLPKLVGPCKARIPRYYFDEVTQKCVEFFYGGCNGNANNFHEIEQCQRKCIKVSSVEQSSTEELSREIPSSQEDVTPIWYACLPGVDELLPNPRNCSSFIQCSNGDAHVMPCPKGLHYSDKTQRCEQPCDAYCNVTLSCKCKWPTCDLPEQCFLPKETGSCRGSYPRYFFNKRTGECEKFQYGGCPGNANNFLTKEACEKKCTKVVPNVCHLPKEVGPCRGSIPRYFFDKVTKKCVKFLYGGCQGNANNFMTIEACEKKCPKVEEESSIERSSHEQSWNEEISTSQEEEIPSSSNSFNSFNFKCPIQEDGLFPNRRNCSSFIQCSNGDAHVMPCPKGLHYSDKTKRCEQPCDAYCNVTLSCKCKWSTCDMPKHCFLPKESGPCRGDFPRYFFNKRTGECEKFQYGGCPGNPNNFLTKEVCEKQCTKVCHLPKEVGPCRGSIPRYFFDKVTKKCVKFLYGGCQGNANNFATIEACEKKCPKVGEESSIELSSHEQSWSEEIETSAENIQSWFKCPPQEGGLFPNPRNCSSFIQCSNGDAIVMPCPKGLHYSDKTQRCERPCEAYCNRTLSCTCKWPTCGLPRVCFLPKQVGPCEASFSRWFFNKRTGECEKFIYGGCQGNPNNFESKEICEKRCTRANESEQEISSADEKLEAKFICPHKTGLFANPRNCSTFVQCSNGIAHVMPCPEGLHYSTKDERCEQPCKAFCNQTLSCECKWPTCGLPAMCFLPAKTGPCKAGFRRWFFNKRTGQCEKFIYGGCQGNGNNFDTKESCQKICRKNKVESSMEEPRQQSWNEEEILTSSEAEFICPQKNGIFRNPSDCKTFYQCSNWAPYLMQCAAELHYSEATKKCEYPCVACCNATIVCPNGNCDKPTTCMLPKVEGPCHASFTRYYFDKTTGECEKFIYGGCQGNANNFFTKFVCEKRCKKVVPTLCELPKEVGPCFGNIPRYFFNKRTEKCEQFTYGGCQGNANNFETIEACEKRCIKVGAESSIEQSSHEQSWNEEISTSQEEEIPTVFKCPLQEDGLFPNPRNCSTFIQCSNGDALVMPCPKGLHYSDKTKRCEQPCDAYCNHTLSCRCKWPTCGLPQSCFLPKKVGPCLANIPRFYFNKRTGECEKFTYGGCQGNTNNYATKEACEKRCSKKEQVEAPQFCELPKEMGPCKANIPRFYFNKDTQQCEKFVYGGCQGNANNFVTKHACEQSCKRVEAPKFCELPKDKGPCRGSEARYYFNPHSQKCEIFVYGGCMGNDNNFATKHECVQSCKQAHAEISSSDEQLETLFKCPTLEEGLFPNPRNCSSFIQCSNGDAIVMPCPKGLHFSDKTQRCERPCDAYCNQTLSCSCKWHTCDLPKQCFHPQVTGPCRANMPRYYFNKRTGMCEVFIYGGCEGNSNNFPSIVDCMTTCRKVVPTVCHLPKEVGPCKGSIPRYFFNKRTEKCEKFIYGGCQGNANNFQTIEACEKRCNTEHME